MVSHNATIPMMGDAQQIIYCENSQGKIVIRSAPLEGEINGTPVLDLIASITDGGKPSIKKRVKNTILKNLQNNMKLHCLTNETGNIQVQIETGTVLSEFNYIEMLKQLTQDNQIECDWGALDEDERTKLKELLDKIREAVSTGMNKPLE